MYQIKRSVSQILGIHPRHQSRQLSFHTAKPYAMRRKAVPVPQMLVPPFFWRGFFFGPFSATAAVSRSGSSSRRMVAAFSSGIVAFRLHGSSPRIVIYPRSCNHRWAPAQSQHCMGGNGEEKHPGCARGLCGPPAGSNFSWIAGGHPAAAQLFAAGCQSGEALHGPMGRKGRKGFERTHQGPGLPVDAARRQSGATAHPGAGRRGGRGLDAAGFHAR